MNEKVSSCYDSSQWNLFLQESLPEKIEKEFLNHLDQCKVCQQKLENCVGSKGQWDSICQKLESQQLETWQPWLDECPVSLSDSSSLGDGREEMSHGVGRLLEILLPSEYPRSVGRLGNYEVFGLIGQGSAGIVLKAWDPKLHRFVAIKVLSPTFSDNGPARRRFQREAKAIAAVSHQQVVPIHAVNEYHGLPYIVMPYLAGGSLQQRIEKDGPLDTFEVVRISLQIANGLSAAHRQGIVHRDVKPANVLLEEGVDRALVSDFGLARVSDDAAATRSGVIAGTPHFMSPEQARGNAVDHRSDLFSLGSVMYCACTGRLPFQSDSIFGVIKKVCDSQPESILKINPKISPWLVDFIGVLHQKEKEMRFSTASEVADLLQAELAHYNNPKVSPAPNRNKYSSKKQFFGRHATLATTMLLFVAVGIGTVAASALTSNRDKDPTWAFSGIPFLPQEKQSKEKQKVEKAKPAANPKQPAQPKVVVSSQAQSVAKPVPPVSPKGNAQPVIPNAPKAQPQKGSVKKPGQPKPAPHVQAHGKPVHGHQHQRRHFHKVLNEIEKLPKFQSDVKHTFDVKPGGTLFVNSTYSDIDIIPADVQKANVVVTRVVRAENQKKADQLFAHHLTSFNDRPTGFVAGRDISVVTKFSDAYIEARKETKNQINPFRNVWIRVQVPRNYHINVETKAGDISLPYLKKNSKVDLKDTKIFTGNIRIHTLGGDIGLGRINGNVQAKTVGGDVSLIEGTGKVNLDTKGGDVVAGLLHQEATLKTHGGDIVVKEIRKPAILETAGGDVVVRNCVEGVKAKTHGGEVSVRFTKDPVVDCVLETQAGEIDVRMPKSINCNVQARSMVGEIDGLERKNRSRSVSKKLGKGGKMVTVRNIAGEIDFRFFDEKTDALKKIEKAKKHGKKASKKKDGETK